MVPQAQHQISAGTSPIVGELRKYVTIVSYGLYGNGSVIWHHQPLKATRIEMIDFRFIAALKRVLFGLVVLALAFAPLQSITPASASTAMAMGKTDCPQKKSCCDKEKSDCMTKQSCISSCYSSFGSMSSAELNVFATGPEKLAMSVTAFLEPHASLPLRRPPRI